jgi:CRP/FNR family transcriptional regulator, cyclic AMP receptor protein
MRSRRTAIGPETTSGTGATVAAATAKLTYLKANELFRDLTPAQLEPFHHTIQMASCRVGHVFYRPGETGEVMFLLKQGAAQLYRLSPDGRKLVFAQVPPASIFGEMACIGQAMHNCFAEAVEDSLICTLSRDDVQRLVVQYPSFALRLLEVIAGRMVEAERQLEALAFKPVVPRLAELLRREARDGLVEGLSHQDLGDRLGVYRETVTEALNELKAAGLLEIGRRRIRLLDEARLQDIADT